MWINSAQRTCQTSSKDMLRSESSKLNKIVSGAAFFLAVIILADPVRPAEGKGRQCWNDKHFVLSSSQSVLDFNDALVTTVREGQIICLANEPNKLEFEVRVEKVQIEVSEPQFKEKLPHIKPFTARVSVCREADVPLGIQITKGKVNHQRDRYGLGRQYRTVCRISDMMMATVLKKDVMVPKPPDFPTVTVSYPERLTLCEFGVREAFVYRNTSVPNKFVVFPQVKRNQRIGAELVNSTFWQGGVHHYYRLVDPETDLAEHAVNFWGTLAEELRQADYDEVIESIGDPRKYQQYTLEELTIKEVK